MKAKIKSHERNLEIDLAAQELLRAWRIQVRYLRQVAKGRMQTMYEPARIAEAEERMKLEIEAVTQTFYEQAQRHNLPVALFRGRLRMIQGWDAENETGSNTTLAPLSPWVDRRLRQTRK